MWKQLLIKWGVISRDYRPSSRNSNKKFSKKLVTKSTQTSGSSASSSPYSSPVIGQRKLNCQHHHNQSIIRQTNVYRGSLRSSNRSSITSQQVDHKINGMRSLPRNLFSRSLDRKTILSSSVAPTPAVSPSKANAGVSLASPEVSSCPSSEVEEFGYSSGEYSILYIDEKDKEGDKDNQRLKEDKGTSCRRGHDNRRSSHRNAFDHSNSGQVIASCSSPSCFSSVSSTSLGRGRTTTNGMRNSSTMTMTSPTSHHNHHTAVKENHHHHNQVSSSGHCYDQRRNFLREEYEHEEDHDDHHHHNHGDCNYSHSFFRGNNQSNMRRSVRSTSRGNIEFGNNRIRDSVRSTRSLPRTAFRRSCSQNQCCQQLLNQHRPPTSCCRQSLQEPLPALPCCCGHCQINSYQAMPINRQLHHPLNHHTNTPAPTVAFLTPCSGGPSCSLNHGGQTGHQEQATQYFIEGPDGRILPVIPSTNQFQEQLDHLQFEDQIVHQHNHEGVLCFGQCNGQSNVTTTPARLFSPTSISHVIETSSPTPSRASTLRTSFRMNINEREQQQRERFSSSMSSSRPSSSSNLSYRGSSFSSIRPSTFGLHQQQTKLTDKLNMSTLQPVPS